MIPATHYRFFHGHDNVLSNHSNDFSDAIMKIKCNFKYVLIFNIQAAVLDQLQLRN